MLWFSSSAQYSTLARKTTVASARAFVHKMLSPWWQVILTYHSTEAPNAFIRSCHTPLPTLPSTSGRFAVVPVLKTHCHRVEEDFCTGLLFHHHPCGCTVVAHRVGIVCSATLSVCDHEGHGPHGPCANSRRATQLVPTEKLRTKTQERC